MNHTYRLVYNAVLNMYVVASEHARSKGKGGGGKAGVTRAAGASPLGGVISGLKTRRKSLAMLAALVCSGHSLAVPVVYFQTLADGRNYFDTTVNTYKLDSTGQSTSYLVGGLAGGSAWNLGGISISANNGATRAINDSYLSNAPSLNGAATGQGINMTASGSDPLGSGLTFNFGSTSLNAFGIELGDWGTCCYASSLYIQFGANGTWGSAQQIGTANARSDVPETTPGTYAFIGAINDTNFFNAVRIYGNGNGDVLWAGGTLRTGNVTLNSVPTNAGSSTQAPAASDITSANPATTTGLAGGNANPVLDGGTLSFDTSTTLTQDIGIKSTGGTVDINGKTGVMAGVIADLGGSGGLTVSNTASGGSLRLAGANTYTGGTVVNSGAHLIVGDGGTHGSIVGDVVDNGKLSFDRSDAVSYAGAISGTGSLAKEGAGVLTLSGNNSYTGATSIASGATLALTGNGSIASSSGVTADGALDISATTAGASIRSLAGNGTVALGGKDLTLTNASGSFGGAIGGSGGVHVTGGSQGLTGNNSYTGGTTLTNASVRINADQGLGGASGGLTLDGGALQTGTTFSSARNTTLAGNGAFATDAGTTFTSMGAIAGNGTLTKEGAGVMVANGVLSHAGGTVVNSGQLVLNGENTYTGGNTVNAGATLAAGRNASLGNTANDVALNGGTLRATDTFGSARDIALAGGGHLAVDAGKTLALGGTVSGNGDLVKDGAGAAVLNGVVSHTGNVVVNNGALTLGADNSYVGSNIVNNGAALVVGKDSNLGNQANHVVLNGGALQATGSFATGRDIAVNGAGHIGVDTGKTLSASGAVSGNGALVKDGAGTLQIDGVASHTGGTVVNGGLLALNGENTYTGGNAVNAGAVLQVGRNAALGNAANGVFLTDGTLHMTGSFETARVIGVTGNSVLDVDGGAIVAASGPVSGNGALIKNGAGALTIDGAASHAGGTIVNGGLLALNGENTYTGGNVVNAGATLQVGKNAALGALANGVTLNNGTLHATGSFETARAVGVSGAAHIDTEAGATVISTGDLAGSGALVKDGAGSLVLNGAVSHAGGATVNGGTLVLNGANSYTGGNKVNNGGTLQVATDASLGNAANGVVLDGGRLRTTTTFGTTRSITLAGNARIDTVDGTTLTAIGAVSGPGRLFKEGSGTLILGGDNINWSGGTTIDAGVVRVISSTGIGTGDVELNGGMIEATVTLTTGQKINVAGNTRLFTQAGTTTTLTGDLQSMNATGISSCFIKSGAGTLNMTGTATLRNGTCVQEGMLRANGVLNSVVTVDEGAFLRGSGLITGPVTVSGTLAPGNSPGTLTAISTVTMASTSTFQADINGLGTASGPGNYSRLLITGAGNQLVINNGATLAPNLVAITGVDTYTPYVPALGNSFRVITAEGGIVGRFAPLAQPAGLAANTRMVAFYNVQNSNSLDLRIVPTSYASYFGSGVNSNIRSVSGALDGALNANDNAGATASQLALAYAVAGANASQLPNLAAALSGQVHGALAAVAPLAGQSLQTTVSRQLAGASAAGAAAAGSAADAAKTAPAQALWADLSANQGRWKSDASASAFDANRSQLTVGADMAQGGTGRFGAGLSHARTNVSALAGSGTVEQNMVFVYGEHALGGVTLDGLASFGRSTWDSKRSDPFLVAGSLENDVRGRDTMVSAGLRAPLQVQGMALEPFARVSWQQSRRDGFQENSATAAAMQLSGYAATGTRVLGGLSGGSRVRDPLAGQGTLRYSVGLGRDNGGLVRPAVEASLAGVGTTILSPAIGRTFVQASVEATAGLGKQSYAYFGLAGEARSGKTDLGVTGGLRIRF